MPLTEAHFLRTHHYSDVPSQPEPASERVSKSFHRVCPRWDNTRLPPRRLFLPREHIFPQMFIELKLHPADRHRACPRCVCVCVCERTLSTSKQRGSDGPWLMCEHWGFVSARSVAHHRAPLLQQVTSASLCERVPLRSSGPSSDLWASSRWWRRVNT